jgi:uncharacterized protein YwbE
MDPRVLTDVKKGMKVKISVHPKHPPEKWIEDKVIDVLDDQEINKDGIEVKTALGYIGNIKEIFQLNTPGDVLSRIKNRENHFIERKETFHYDADTDKRNKDRNLDVVKAVVAFMNSDGGHVYIGVHDNGKILGLDRDYQCMSENQRDDDSFERQIRDSLAKNLTNNSMVTDCTKNISFPKPDGIEVCEIEVQPSEEPIFFKEKNGMAEKDGKKEQWAFTDFIKRKGNAKETIKTHAEFLKYYQTKFQNRKKI